jgi:urease accessory protein
MMRAQLHLAFSVLNGRTHLHCAQQDPPWKVVRAFPNPADESLVHLNNVSGGVFGGDGLNLQVEVGPAAAAQITTTGSTRIYRPSESSTDALLISKIHVSEGALLEYLPDSIIPFRDSRCEQRTEVRLEPAATLFWWEIIAPGRLARGESFAYASLRTRYSIWSQGRPIYIDRMHLRPQLAKPSSLARMGKFHYLTSFMICRSKEDPTTWIVLEQMLREIAQQRSRSDVLWGASALTADGVLVRGLSQSAVCIIEDLFCFWNSAKMYLCGRAPSPPRKTY